MTAEGTSKAADPIGDATERDPDEVAAGEIPGIDFVTFVLSLSHSAYLHLGDAPDPLSGSVQKNLTMARQTIDLLGLLEEKTQGNLTGEEERVLDQVLYELRLRYLEVERSGS